MMDNPGIRQRIRVGGQVQGVGFRPFVHALAARLGLTGWVLNDGAGVLAEVQGPAAALAGFMAALTAETPPLARIDRVITEDAPAQAGEGGFVIRASRGGTVISTGVAPDAAVCPACLAEMCDPTARRYRYPFLNCTHCGPRYTITRRLPYDRPQTSMAGFPLCPDCRREYADPADRRFHAQPVACPVCGPRLSHAIEDVVAHLRAGRIVALKGLGGFHLACDAMNDAAVARLRQVKQRNGKPFAVMVANGVSAARLADLDPAELAALDSPARPIVIARRRDGAGQGLENRAELAGDVAPGLAWLGVMLPSTPLHYLLFHEAAGRPDGVDWLTAPQALTLVMTSANPGGEPLAIANDEAAARLADIADVIVDHDRDIVIRADDSVMRRSGGALRFIRRGRGFAPAPIRLARPQPPTLALGGRLKNAVCITRGDEAFLSQHIGDLDNAATYGFFVETIDHLLHVLGVTPEIVAHDRHPDFLSSRHALGLGLPAVAVQHHHAHVAAVLAEHGIEAPALGLALDGFGLGDDGGSWGGEMLLVDGGRCERLGRLAPLAQPGGDIAARQPWRMAAAALHRMGRGDEISRRFGGFGPADGVRQMLARGVNAPPASSCGRWFDAACGLLGVQPLAGYEGEAPMLLESLVRRPRVDGRWWRIDQTGTGRELDLTPLLERLLTAEDAADGADLFHGGLVAALLDWVLPALQARGLGQVVLSGGCLMNAVLADGLVAGCAAAGVTALLPRLAPANDGGLALGQAWVAGRT